MDRHAVTTGGGSGGPARVVLYTIPGKCPLCDEARELLHREGVAFAEVDIPYHRTPQQFSAFLSSRRDPDSLYNLSVNYLLSRARYADRVASSGVDMEALLRYYPEEFASRIQVTSGSFFAPGMNQGTATPWILGRGLGDVGSIGIVGIPPGTAWPRSGAPVSITILPDGSLHSTNKVPVLIADDSGRVRLEWY